jgi:hypothetical protein
LECADRTECGDDDDNDILAKDCKDSTGDAECGAAEKFVSGICKVMPVGRFKGGNSWNDDEVGENASAAERFKPGARHGETTGFGGVM